MPISPTRPQVSRERAEASTILSTVRLAPSPQARRTVGAHKSEMVQGWRKDLKQRLRGEEAKKIHNYHLLSSYCILDPGGVCPRLTNCL